MPARHADERPEIHRARLLPRPSTGADGGPHVRAVVRTAVPRRARWTRAAVVVACLAALGYGIWQEGVAGEAQSRLAALAQRFDDLEQEAAALRTENDALRVEVDRLQEDNERLVGELAVLRAANEETVDEQAVVALVLPYLRERLGDSLGTLAEAVSLDELGDLIARSWAELRP